MFPIPGGAARSDCSAASLPAFFVDGEPDYPSWDDRACSADDLKVCDPACAEGWGLWTPPAVDCSP